MLFNLSPLTCFINETLFFILGPTIIVFTLYINSYRLTQILCLQVAIRAYVGLHINMYLHVAVHALIINTAKSLVRPEMSMWEASRLPQI